MNKVKLSKVAKYSNKRISADKVSLDNYITTDNILQNRAGITTANNLPPGSNAMPAYERNNILIANIRPYLKKIWFANRSGGCSADVLVLEANEGYDSKFIYYSLFKDDFFEHMMRGAKGTKMPRGDKNQILDFLISDLDLPTQQKIAAVLSALDAKIELNNRINAELEAMAKTLYDYWFVQFDFPDENGRPYKTSGGRMVWSEELKREIPEGWGVLRLNELLQNRSDSTTPSELGYDELYTPIDSLPMKKMSFGIGQPSTEANTSLIRYKANDILIGAMRVYFHRVCIAPFDGITRTTTLVLRPKKQNYLPYLYQVCNEDRTINVASKISVGTQQPYVNWEGALENYTIPYPENDTLVKKYSSMMVSVTKDLINREKENGELAKLRDWLLPMLMNGQVRVE